MLLQRKKANSLVRAIFFSIAWRFWKNRGDRYWYTIFFALPLSLLLEFYWLSVLLIHRHGRMLPGRALQVNLWRPSRVLSLEGRKWRANYFRSFSAFSDMRAICGCLPQAFHGESQEVSVSRNSTRERKQ